MIPENQLESSNQLNIFKGDEFKEWTSLNDTIMGGSSSAFCYPTKDGLLFKGTVVEESGGFVSCRSQFMSPPLDLTNYLGIRLEVEGRGRTLKFAIASQSRLLGMSEFLTRNLRWVAEVPTQSMGITFIDIPFDNFQPTIRSKPFLLPVRMQISSIFQLQLLHSKFGQPGKLNPEFKTGPIQILLRSISAFR